jgi:hypothetical protein
MPGDRGEQIAHDPHQHHDRQQAARVLDGREHDERDGERDSDGALAYRRGPREPARLAVGVGRGINHREDCGLGQRPCDNERCDHSSSREQHARVEQHAREEREDGRDHMLGLENEASEDRGVGDGIRGPGGAEIGECCAGDHRGEKRGDAEVGGDPRREPDDPQKDHKHLGAVVAREPERLFGDDREQNAHGAGGCE